ncbi:MAG: hypothetical protein M3021_06320, partial [Actinomycetota bacterium]|nr:hypothetical protein [Actinomycetota bacterium]
STITVGTLTIDPRNHYVYAGTGDLTFGSFSFGSAGILKSTDQGATWQVKGADVFSMPYPEPPGHFPQYNSIGGVVIDPHNSNNLAAGTKTGLYFSYDGGDNWAGPCLPDPFPNQRQDVTDMFAITRTNSLSDLFVAVGSRGYSTTVQYNLAENGANGIYKVTFPSSGCPVNWSLISRGNNGWPAGTGSGIPQYRPGGDQAGRINIAVAHSNHNYIYAEAQAIRPGNGGLQRGGMLGVWRSTDGGSTWQQRATAQSLENAESACGGDCITDPLGVCGDYPQNWYDQRIAVDPTNPDFILFDNDDVWRSADGGATVEDITCGYASIQVHRQVHVDQHAITFVPGGPGTQVLIGNDGGVDYTPDVTTQQGVFPTFLQLNASLNTIEFYGGDISAGFATSLNQYAVAGAQDNGSSSWPETVTTTPNIWGQRIGGDGIYARIEPVLGLRVYMEAPNGALRLSESGHRGPYPLDNDTTNYTVDGPRLSFVFPYEIYKGVPVGTPGGGDDTSCALPNGCMHMIAGTFRVWENTGGARIGNPWVPVSPDLTKGTLADRSFINQLAFAPRTDSLAIAGTNDGNVAIGFNLGSPGTITSTWHNVTGGNSVLPNRPVLDVAFRGDVLGTSLTPVGYASIGGFNENTPGTPGHVFQVACGAHCTTFTWTNKSGNLPDIPVDSIISNPNFPRQVFAGSDWGVYYTNNIDLASPTWYRFDTGMPNVMVWDFSIDRGFTTLAAFTRSRGAFVWPLPSAPFVQPTATGTPPTATGTVVAITRTPAIPPTYTQGPSSTPTSTDTPQPSPTP